MKILLELAYDGSGFAGYQVQPGKITVQSALQDAIERVYGERYPLKGCSRTDAGVHALQYFATFDTDKQIPLDRLPLALNAALDDRVAILSAAAVPDSFHVRHDVRLKEYEYRLLTGKIPDPFARGRCWHYPKPLRADGVARMREASRAFIGRHDFAGFMSAGSNVADTVREIYSLDVIENGKTLIFRVSANGFLYNMVRIIVGTLVDVACGRIDADEMAAIIASCNRSRAGMTAPPDGLYLRRVEFL